MSNILLAILATWRITSLLYSERGPGDVFEKLRELVGIGHHEHEPTIYPLTFLGGLFECFWCLSIWCSIPIAALTAPDSWPTAILTWLSASAGAIIISEIGGEHGES